MYIVIDRRTNEQDTKTVYKSRAAANRAVDRLDNEYGGYRYFAKAVG